MLNNKWVFLIVGVLLGVYVIPQLRAKVGNGS